MVDVIAKNVVRACVCVVCLSLGNYFAEGTAIFCWYFNAFSCNFVFAMPRIYERK